MAASTERNSRKIIIEKNGPYLVQGSVPLVRKTQIVSEYGEPLTWHKTETLSAGAAYCLCRCGHSRNMPFCDDTHETIGFDGAETADVGHTADRQEGYPGGTHLVVKRDMSLCTEAGFCGNRLTNIRRMLKNTAEPHVRAEIIGMIERCPSGSFTYAIEPGQPDIEPDLPPQIAVTTEITDGGPIAGPLWVTGGITIERSDGQPLETRNRVTLCNCGRSRNKPLCDGSHRRPLTT